MRYGLLLLILLIGCKRSHSKDDYLKSTLTWNTNALAAQYATDQKFIRVQYTNHPSENRSIYLEERHLDSLLEQTLLTLNRFEHSSFRNDSVQMLRTNINHYYNEIQKHAKTRLDDMADLLTTHKEFPSDEKFIIIKNRLYLNAVNCEHQLAMKATQLGCDQFPFPKVFDEDDNLTLGDSFRAFVEMVENTCEKPVSMHIMSLRCNGKKIPLSGTAIFDKGTGKIDLLPEKKGKYVIRGAMSIVRSPKDTTVLYFDKSFVVN